MDIETITKHVGLYTLEFTANPHDEFDCSINQAYNLFKVDKSNTSSIIVGGMAYTPLQTTVGTLARTLQGEATMRILEAIDTITQDCKRALFGVMAGLFVKVYYNGVTVVEKQHAISFGYWFIEDDLQDTMQYIIASDGLVTEYLTIASLARTRQIALLAEIKN